MRLAILLEALGALWANKLRSSLTILGMVMGVMAVIAIVSTVEGMQKNMEDSFASMGPNTFIVTRFGITTSWDDWAERSKRKKITRDMARPILEGCDLCDEVGAENSDESVLKYRDISFQSVEVQGQTPNLINIQDIKVEQGRYFSEEDDASRRAVVFIGYEVVEKFFKTEDPLGKVIRINGKPFTVIGVGAKNGAVLGHSMDRYVSIPLSVFQRMYYTPGNPVRLFVKAASSEVREGAMDQTRVVLRALRHVPFDKSDDFELLTPDQIIEFINSFTRAFRVIIFALPSLAIIIGGIVVMNIMMVSVTERTREIGVRKSLGARRKDILSQFLYESLSLSIIGGGVGALLGGLVASSLLTLMDIAAPATALGFILGIGISTGVGLFFGIYPAMKAARLDPIKALSYE